MYLKFNLLCSLNKPVEKAVLGQALSETFVWSLFIAPKRVDHYSQLVDEETESPEYP